MSNNKQQQQPPQQHTHNRKQTTSTRKTQRANSKSELHGGRLHPVLRLNACVDGDGDGNMMRVIRNIGA